MTVSTKFETIYGREPLRVAFTPYRICPLGAHVDHQQGCITGFAINKGIHIAYGEKQNGVVEISSMQFEKRAQWHVLSTPPAPVGDWADLLRGATVALAARYHLRVGLCAVVDGELPIGGLSSSAAVVITFLAALSSLNGIFLSRDEIIDLALEAENKYVGVSCGRLDQCCEVYCKRENLFYMDIRTGKYEQIPQPKNMKPYKIAIFFSGLERSLAGSLYNTRVDEAKTAAYTLLSHAGIKRASFRETYLRDVPREIFDKYGSRLPENLYKRALHWYTEMERVSLGVEAWRSGDLESFGKYVFESGKSSIEAWETGSPELQKLYEIMSETDGIYGGRFSGAGFKGCCMALIDPEKEAEILEKVGREYTAAFPHLKENYSAYICETADGVKLAADNDDDWNIK